MISFAARTLALLTLMFSLLGTDQAFGIAYTWNVTGPSNWNIASNWSPVGVPGTSAGDTGTISTGAATINTQLAGGPSFLVTGTGKLFWNALAVQATTGTIEVSSGGMLQFEGSTTSPSPTAVLLSNGARLGRFTPWTSITASVDDFTIAAAAIANVDALRSHIALESAHRLELRGMISGSGTLVVKPGLYNGNTFIAGTSQPTPAQGQFRIAPTSTTGNTFSGVVEVEGLSATQLGILALGSTDSGAGALANATLTMKAHGMLVMAGAKDPFGLTAKSINFLGTNRILWDGASTYSAPASANVATFNLVDGTRLGRYTNWTSTDTINETLSIASGDTAYADFIRSHIALESVHRLQLSGQLVGDADTKLIVKPNEFNGNTFIAGTSQPTAPQGQFRIAPTSANSNFLGTVEVEGLSATQLGILGLGGTGALSNGTLDIKNHAMLVMAGATDPFGSAAKTINFLGNSRILWDGASTYTQPGLANVATFNLVDGTRLGRYTNWTSTDTINETLSIASNATAYADFIRSHIALESVHRLQLSGQLVGDSTTSLVVKPNQFSGNTLIPGTSQPIAPQGQFRIAPTSATGNAGFLGTVVVEGLSATQHGILGIGGTGAFVNGVSHLQLLDHSTLEIAAPTNPFGTTAAALNIPGTGRVMWNGATTYSAGVLTLNLNDGAQLGRYTNWTTVDTSRENWNLVSGATVYADAIRAHIPGTLVHRMDLTGALSGDDTTKLVVRPGMFTTAAPGNGGQGALRIAPSAALGNTGFTGTVEVSGTSALGGQVGMLQLDGVAALGNGTLNILTNGVVAVTTNGALSGAESIDIATGGLLRIQRNSLPADLANTTLSGNGLIRVETVNTASLLTNSASLQSLNLNNVTIAPGNSAGTLTFQAATMTLGAGTVLQSEIGLTSDILAVTGSGVNTGNLVLTPGSTLEISDLAGLTPGTHVIATYSGTLTGEFGTIVNNLNAIYLLNGINYGSGVNSFISLDISFAPVPEPNTGLLAGLGFIGAMVVRRKKRAQK